MPAPFFEPHAGHLVTPSVRLVRPLGQGGMGSVWIADHLTLRTKVAVKFMSTTLATDEVFRDRFSREAGAAAQVRSPHVVQVLDHGVGEGGLPFIIMELLEGESLAARLSVPPKLQPGEVVAIVGQVCKALTRAHERGIVHRDIKPDNVFLCDADGDVFVKVLDFGVAKDIDTLGATTASGSLVGTPVYMSPEQILGKRDIDGRVDLWALGIMAYEMLAGKRPFHGDTVGALAIAIHQRDFERPTALAPNLPAAIDDWFEKACHRDREQRFRTPREFAESLEKALGMASVVDKSGPIRVERTELPLYSVPSDGLAATVNVSSQPAVAVSKETAATLAMTPAPSPTLGGASVRTAARPRTPKWWIAAPVLAAIAAIGFFATRRTTPAAPTPGAAAPTVMVASSAPPTVSTSAAASTSTPSPEASAAVSAKPTASATTVAPKISFKPSVLPKASASTAPVVPKPKKPDEDDIQ
ncbi:MAG: serine/threonine protein kinase [Myxococcales bacterium]|nr:serine/threonine protein kinase [Myxococcales bacterium]